VYKFGNYLKIDWWRKLLLKVGDIEMDLVESLRNKKVRVIEIPKWGTYLRR
jgi:hypothetical protein